MYPTPTNADRADHARAAVQAHVDRTVYEEGERKGWERIDPESHVTDLLCDLQHLVDELGLDWETLTERASGHHDAEVIEEHGERHEVTIAHDHQSYWGTEMTTAQIGRWIQSEKQKGRAVVVELYSDEEGE